MSSTVARFEMPIRDPCPFCELAAGRGETRHVVEAKVTVSWERAEEIASLVKSHFKT